METIDTFSSSNIAQLGYDSTNATLEVTFRNGRVYHYYDVPSVVWEEFKNAESKGAFLNTRIKGTYRYSRA